MDTSLSVYGHRGEVELRATTDWVTSDGKIARDPLFVAARANSEDIEKCVFTVDDVTIEATYDGEGDWTYEYDGKSHTAKRSNCLKSSKKKGTPVTNATRDKGPDVLMVATAIAGHFDGIQQASRGGGSKSDTKAVIQAKLSALEEEMLKVYMGPAYKMSEEDARAKLASITIVPPSAGQAEAREAAREAAVEAN